MTVAKLNTEPNAAQKAFGYVRVSGKGQVDGDGFPRQKLAISEYAKLHNLDIVRVYEERGVTGTASTESRDAWMEMMLDSRKEGVKIVVIEKLDRLARDLMVQESTIVQVQDLGIDLQSVLEPDLCSTDPTRVMMRQIMGSVAQYDKSMITDKLSVARARMRVKTGRCEGVKPYGEDPKRPDEIETREMIIDLAKMGTSANQIARELNDAGIVPRKASKWHPFTVIGILKIAGIPLAHARKK